MNQFKLSLVGAMAMLFVGCQSTPTNPPATQPKAKQEQETSQKTQKDKSKVVVTPQSINSKPRTTVTKLST